MMNNDKKPEVHLILVIVQGEKTTTLDESGRIRTKSSDAYRSNYDNVFGKKPDTHTN